MKSKAQAREMHCARVGQMGHLASGKGAGWVDGLDRWGERESGDEDSSFEKSEPPHNPLVTHSG